MWPDVMVRVALDDACVSPSEGVEFHRRFKATVDGWARHAVDTGGSVTSQGGEARQPSTHRVVLVAEQGGHDAYDSSEGMAQAAAFLLSAT